MKPAIRSPEEQDDEDGREDEQELLSPLARGAVEDGPRLAHRVHPSVNRGRKVLVAHGHAAIGGVLLLDGYRGSG